MKEIIILSERKCGLKHPAYNTILGLENEFLLSGNVKILYFNFFVLKINIILKKIFGRCSFRDSRLIKESKKMGGYYLFNCMSINDLLVNFETLKEISHNRNCKLILYCFDTWEPQYTEFEKIFKTIEPQYLFCTYLKSAKYFQTALPKTNVFWLQQSMDKTVFYDYKNKKTRIFMQMGRKNESLHKKTLGFLKNNNIQHCDRNYIYEKKEGEIIYKNKYDLARNINATKFFITAPQNIDNFKKTGNISEVTARYFEAMAAKSLIVGYKPEDSFDILFPFDNAMIMVKPDGSDFDEKINYYLENEDEYNEIINRNYRYVNNNHTWTNRLNYIIECLNEKELDDN